MTRKPRILHLIQSLENGGCENMLLRTLPLLSKEFEQHIVTLRTPGHLASRFEEKGIPTSHADQRSVFCLAGYRNLLSEIRAFSPDIILTYLFHADMIGRNFLRRKTPIPIIPFLRTTYRHPKYWVARILEKLTRHLAPIYLANSEAVRRFYISEIGIKPEKITVIPNGIDTEYFDNIAMNPELRQSLALSSNEFVIICVANFHASKGHQYLLEAFESIFPKFNQAKLLLVGDGNGRRDLERRVESYRSKNSILFLGNRTDVPELLKISNCFVLPTLFEGMSNALMEAMATGLPIITTDIPENHELIENMRTGILVPIKNSKKIAESLNFLMSSPERQKLLGNSARNFVKEKFSLRTTTRMLASFLHSL